MKRYNLTKIHQNGKDFYALVADPRIIVRLLPQYNAGETQEIQRPWEEKRVREIAKYVAGKFSDNDGKKSSGLIPNAPILNAKSKIILEEDTKGPYVMLPETESEIGDYSETIEAIDGQHRIRAFMSDYLDVDFANTTLYEMCFTLFFQLSTNEKKEIFMITNEKQLKVSNNLLRMYKRELNLLGDEGVFDLVCELNTQDYSPLQKRIMIGSEKIAKGYQESQISKILNKSNVYNKISYKDKDSSVKLESMAKLISLYLKAWEREYAVSFQDPGKDTITKISGLRYIIYLFNDVLDILAQRKVKPSVDEFRKIIGMLPDATAIDNVFTNEVTSLSFRSESATVELVKIHGNQLKAYEQANGSNYDMFEGL